MSAFVLFFHHHFPRRGTKAHIHLPALWTVAQEVCVGGEWQFEFCNFDTWWMDGEKDERGSRAGKCCSQILQLPRCAGIATHGETFIDLNEGVLIYTWARTDEPHNLLTIDYSIKTFSPNIWSGCRTGRWLFGCTCRVYVSWELFHPDRRSF